MIKCCYSTGMLGVSLWKALCRKIAQAEEERDGDRAFTSIRKAIRAIPSSEGNKIVTVEGKELGQCQQSFIAFSLFFAQILQIVHTVEECPDTLAFATEPVLASLANILAFYVSHDCRPFFCHLTKFIHSLNLIVKGRNTTNTNNRRITSQPTPTAPETSSCHRIQLSWYRTEIWNFAGK